MVLLDEKWHGESKSKGTNERMTPNNSHFANAKGTAKERGEQLENGCLLHAIWNKQQLVQPFWKKTQLGL